MPKVKQCSKDADVKGNLKIKFTITGEGKVVKAQIMSGDFQGSTVGECVLKLVKSLRFRAYGGKDLPVTYPFRIE